LNSYYRDEEETPKDPAAEQAKILLAFIKTPAKTLSPREETVDSPRLEEPVESPRAPPKKRTKKTNDNTGIKISENPLVPSMDDVSFLLTSSFLCRCNYSNFFMIALFLTALQPIAREMMDMAIRYIGFRDEASELSGQKNF
jgi:hypothetical protein